MLNLLSCCRPQHVELRNAFCRFAWHRAACLATPFRRAAFRCCRHTYMYIILSFTHTGPKAEGHKLRLRTGRSRRKNRHFVIVKWENEQKKGKRKMNTQKNGRTEEREKKICSLCKLATGNRCKFWVYPFIRTTVFIHTHIQTNRHWEWKFSLRTRACLSRLWPNALRRFHLR